MATIATVERLALALPEVVEGTSYGNRCWLVRKMPFVWERPFSKADLRRFGDVTPPDGPIVGVRVGDLAEKEATLAERHAGVFTIAHLDGFAAGVAERDLRDLVAELDFISLHTYPVWEYKHIHEALDYTKDNYYSVANLYPGKPVIITEAGWATNSNGRGINPGNVGEEMQKIYIEDLMEWTQAEQVFTFVFEAFDEPWKGSPEPLEPEKHWGLYRVDRRPKLVVK